MDYKDVGFLHEQFVNSAKIYPSKTAVVDKNQGSLSYKELDLLSNVLARVLQEKGVKENVVVVIYMDKCIQYVVSYISILKAGGGYLPLDISYPENLIKDILTESEPSIIITKSSFLKNFHSYKNVLNIICLDDHEYQLEIERLAPKTKRELVTNVSLESIAFVVYSSGTTGKPKGKVEASLFIYNNLILSSSGIVVPLRAPIISYLSRHEGFPYGENEKEAANIFFVWELLRPLMKGI